MKKLVLAILLTVITLTANAVPLFPYFVDVAGDYKDGTPDAMAKVNIICSHWNKPSWYTSLKAAQDFLNDVLPFSNESITQNSEEVNGTKVVTYTSPMYDGEQTSILYLIEDPIEGFFVGYTEKIN